MARCDHWKIGQNVISKSTIFILKIVKTINDTFSLKYDGTCECSAQYRVSNLFGNENFNLDC